MWNLVKTTQAVSEKTFKNYTTFARGKDRQPPGDKILIVIKGFTT